MKIIYKYLLNIQGVTTIQAPIIKFLDIQIQNNIPTIWAIVDTEGKDICYTIAAVGTGWEIDTSVEEAEYLGTVQDNAGCVWHYFAERVVPGTDRNELKDKAFVDLNLYKILEKASELYSRV